MDISYISLLWFIIGTIIYFIFIKSKLNIDILDDNSKLLQYYSDNNYNLGIYILFTVFIQIAINIMYLKSKCGMSKGTFFSAFMFTLIPWVFIFTVMVAVIVMFPGFKSAFSDVIGYFVVSRTANELLSTILINTDVNDLIKDTTDTKKKDEMTHAAETIMKICGNKAVLINQMSPDNFTSIWNTLKPLMKDDIFKNDEIRQQLLDIVVLKDNVGEAIWYVYTAILISSIVYYNLSTRGCVKDPDTIKADYDEYIKEQEEIEKKNAINNSSTYTIS
jgi:hypothetical protein